MLTKEQRAVLDKNDLGNYDNEEVGPTDAWAIFNLYKGAIEELADTRLQLAEARRDAERVAWAIRNGVLAYVPGCGWNLHAFSITGGIRGTIWLENAAVWNFTPEARAIIDAAMAAEEQTT